MGSYSFTAGLTPLPEQPKLVVEVQPLPITLIVSSLFADCKAGLHTGMVALDTRLFEIRWSLITIRGPLNPCAGW